MAAFIQLIGMLAGVGILGYVALQLMGYEHTLRKTTAKTEKLIVDTYEAVSKRLDTNSRHMKGNSELLLMIEDLKREIHEREL